MDDKVNSGITDVDEKCALGYEAKLLFDEEMANYIADGVNEQDPPVLRSKKRDVIHLKDDLSREEIQGLYERYIRMPGSFEAPSGDKKKNQPYISEVLKLSTCEDMSEFWEMVAEAIPEDPDYKEISEYWVNAVRQKNDKIEEQERYAQVDDPDLLKLAGVPDDNIDDIIAPPARQEVGEEIIASERYPKNFNLDFSGDYLTINKVPTNIATVFIKNTYVGLAGLLSHDRAIQIVSKIIKKKIDPLFEVEK
jgi:hypothetical protein